jgi:hypothetical protein
MFNITYSTILNKKIPKSLPFCYGTESNLQSDEWRSPTSSNHELVLNLALHCHRDIFCNALRPGASPLIATAVACQQIKVYKRCMDFSYVSL